MVGCHPFHATFRIAMASKQHGAGLPKDLLNPASGESCQPNHSEPLSLTSLSQRTARGSAVISCTREPCIAQHLPKKSYLWPAAPEVHTATVSEGRDAKACCVPLARYARGFCEVITYDKMSGVRGEG